MALLAVVHQSIHAYLWEDAIKVEDIRLRAMETTILVDLVYEYYPPYPLLSADHWYFRVPLLLAVVCVAYVVVECSLCGAGKVMGKRTGKKGKGACASAAQG